MKKTAAALAAFLGASSPALADANGVDYCIHHELVKHIATLWDADVTKPFKAVFSMNDMKPFIATCEGARYNKSGIFSKTRREYTHVEIEANGSGDSFTGMMTAVPKYKHLRY